MARAIVMPTFGMYTDEGTLHAWLKPSGSSVEMGEPVAEIETEKVTAEVMAPQAGILHHVAQPGVVLQVESLLGYVLAPGESPPTTDEPSVPAPADATASAAPPTPVPRARPPREGFASPNARRLAAELGVDLTGLTGTGPGGRITEIDVRAALDGGTG